VDVYRTFADGEEHARRRVRRGSAGHTTPTGRVHAADQEGWVTLCGLPTSDLVEFGRSRYPFEGMPMTSRCARCNELAGRPLLA
jgi:hypothetical protein